MPAYFYLINQKLKCKKINVVKVLAKKATNLKPANSQVGQPLIHIANGLRDVDRKLINQIV